MLGHRIGPVTSGIFVYAGFGSRLILAGGWWLVAGGWWLVAGGWWLVAGGWWLVAQSQDCAFQIPAVS
jgi:hypothetical protein